MFNADVKETQIERNKTRFEEYRDLVHATVKDVTWIGTEISDDKQFINIQIVFGSRYVAIPIRFEDIEKNRFSTKGFLRLIVDPLETLLRRIPTSQEKT